MPEYAVIDIGTFSLLLLIAETGRSGVLKPVQEKYEIARLGEDVKRTGFLREDAMQRALSIMDTYYRLIGRYSDIQVFVIGSEVLRRAQNSDTFASEIKQCFGWDLHILNAEEEARLSYAGVLSGFPDWNERRCVLDVGGGSTEFSIGEGKNILAGKSLALGAAVLYEQGGKKASLCSGERLELVQFTKLLLEEAGINVLLSGIREYIACGGTATTLAAIKKKLTAYYPGAVNGLALSREEIWDIYFRLNDLTPQQRRDMPGMESGREVIVLYGALIILTLMDWLQVEYIRVSDRGLRYGYLVNELLKKRTT